MSTGKVVMHSLLLVILFWVIAIFINPLTDGIGNGTLRVLIKELVRIFLTIGMFGLYARLFFKKSNAYFRIQNLKDAGLSWYLIGLAMPIATVVLYLLTGYVVFERQVHPFEIALTYIFKSLITACAAGIIEEFLFRGYLFKIIEDKWNIFSAVIATSILFSALHLLTMKEFRLIEVCLLLLSGTLVGIMFSLIVYKTGNVWNAVVVHIIWNFFFSSNIVQFAPSVGDGYYSLVLFRFKTENPWITGGLIGIEMAVPAIVMYMIMICWITIRKSNVHNNSVTH